MNHNEIAKELNLKETNERSHYNDDCEIYETRVDCLAGLNNLANRIKKLLPDAKLVSLENGLRIDNYNIIIRFSYNIFDDEIYEDNYVKAFEFVQNIK